MQLASLPCALKIHGGRRSLETDPGGPVTVPFLQRKAAGLQRRLGRGVRDPGIAELRRRVRGAGVTHALINYGTMAAWLGPVLHGEGVEVVPHFHGYDAHELRVLDDNRDAYRDLGRYAKAVIAVSGPMRDSLVAAGIPTEKIHVVRYGVDAGKFTAKESFPEDPLFFGVGRFVDKKAPHLTLLAFSKVLERFPKARLVLGGDGALLESTRNLAIAMGIDSSVEMPGPIPHEEVANWIRKATCLVQHSLVPQSGDKAGDSEGTPVAILEALVCGLPVVATRHAGIQEVLRDGETGFLVDERDTNGMAEAMARLAADRGMAVRMGATARADALEKYTATRYLDSLRAVLNS